MIARDKRKGLVALDNVDTLANDELSSGNFPSLNLSLINITRESARTRSHKRSSPHPAFNDVVSGASCRAMRKVGIRQYQSGQALGNPLVLPTGTLPLVPPMHPTFGVKPMFYIPQEALIQRLDDMLSSPLGQHILDYEPLRKFVILAFTTFDGLADPYDHMLHYNKVMTLNAGNDLLLCQGTKNRIYRSIYHRNI